MGGCVQCREGTEPAEGLCDVGGLRRASRACTVPGTTQWERQQEQHREVPGAKAWQRPPSGFLSGHRRILDFFFFFLFCNKRV